MGILAHIVTYTLPITIPIFGIFVFPFPCRSLTRGIFRLCLTRAVEALICCSQRRRRSPRADDRRSEMISGRSHTLTDWLTGQLVGGGFDRRVSCV